MFENYLLRKINFIELSIQAFSLFLSRALEISPKYLSDLEKFHPDEFLSAVQTARESCLDFLFKLLTVGVHDGYIKPDLDISISSRFMHSNLKVLVYDKADLESSSLNTTEFKKMFWEVNLSNYWTEKALAEIERQEQLVF